MKFINLFPVSARIDSKAKLSDINVRVWNDSWLYRHTWCKVVVAWSVKYGCR